MTLSKLFAFMMITVGDRPRLFYCKCQLIFKERICGRNEFINHAIWEIMWQWIDPGKSMNCESLLEEQITLTIIVMRMSLSAMGWFDSVSFAFTTIVDNSICNLFVILSLTLSLSKTVCNRNHRSCRSTFSKAHRKRRNVETAFHQLTEILFLSILTSSTRKWKTFRYL